MPPQVASTIAKLEAQGRFTRGRGRMRSVHLSQRGALDIVHALADGPETTDSYDVVIQTVGLNTDTQRTEHRLVRQLVIDGMVTPDPLGLGFAAQPDGHLLDGNGRPRPNLFAIGSLLRGALWESTAIPEIRKQAQGVANMLLAETQARVATR